MPIQLFRRSVILCIVGAIAACERRIAIEPPICDVNETGIGDSTIGPLAIGEAVPALRQRCQAVGDTTVVVPMLGWNDSVRALRLMVRNTPVLATYDSVRTTAGPGGATVTALRVESPFFRTNDSLGVGTSVAKFRNLRGIRITQLHDSRRVVLLDRRRCGVAYELSRWGGPAPAVGAVNADTMPQEPSATGMALAGWPDSIVVTAVNVTGCRGNVRDLGVDSVTEALDSAELASRLPTTAVDSLPVSQLPSGTRMPPPPGAPPVTSPAPSPSAVPTATTSELTQLAALLEMPVQGVARSQLRDTYAEPRSGHSHEALDILASRGTPVLSATDGTLRKLHNSKAGGLMVYAGDASDRFVLLYGHLDRYADGLKEGMPLRRGQVIGYVGTTGNAPIATPHLHFAILRGKPSAAWWRGTAVNPYPLLRR